MTALADLNVITIAAIQGYCLGGGLQLALACDLRYTKRQIDSAFGQETERQLKDMSAVYQECLRSLEHAEGKTDLLAREKGK